ncbi:MAG: type II toxin-antitoxin system VapC family toxin [Geopsychrobacter sp.]|nr:type II toxin-antitoxin system VapC family toxin [Geopsychrobacter sp.]
MLMLDTNICIYIIKQKPPVVLERFREYQVGDIGISSITLAELHYGVAKSQYREKNLAALEEFIIPLEILSFDEQASHTYGEIRAGLESAGTPIGAMDLLIAAHAVALGVTLVTNNTREFVRVPNLAVANWVDEQNSL